MRSGRDEFGTVLIAAVAVAVVFAVAILIAIAAPAYAGQFERSAFRDVSDILMPETHEGFSGDFSDAETQECTEVPEDEETAPTGDEGTVSVDLEPMYEEPDYVEPSYGAAYAPTDGLTKEGGVNYHDGRTETYYSSAVTRHVDTDEWTLDDEGFYRTDEGYYVVAASDMEQGTTFEGSKGTCVVLDTGCPSGVTDYYCAF